MSGSGQKHRVEPPGEILGAFLIFPKTTSLVDDVCVGKKLTTS